MDRLDARQLCSSQCAHQQLCSSTLCRVEEFKGEPKFMDKLVARRLAQVYTPGTVLDGPMLVRAGLQRGAH